MADLFLTLVAIFLLAPAVGVAFQVASADEETEPTEVVTVTLAADGALAMDDGSSTSWVSFDEAESGVEVLLIAGPGVSAASLLDTAQDAASHGLAVQLAATPTTP